VWRNEKFEIVQILSFLKNDIFFKFQFFSEKIIFTGIDIERKSKKVSLCHRRTL